MKQRIKNQFIDYFKGRAPFSRQELYDYYLDTEGEMKEGTLGWRIYDLKKKNILREVRKGWYTVDVHPFYNPIIDPTVKELAQLFTKNFRDTRYCVWNLTWLNEFTVHQFNFERIIFEIEKDLQESFANLLGDNGYNNVVWDVKGPLPRNNFKEIPIVLLPLISRAPVQDITTDDGQSVVVPTLEKILVDIYEGKSIFRFLQGAEVERVFEHAVERYAINYATLFNYAKRRGKEPELNALLSKYVPDTLIK
ncbi:MAG: hypothetical protein P4L51_07350 [Puia sp.]|nr:hypothetical protein [Puia sp.]